MPLYRSLHDHIMREAVACGRMKPKDRISTQPREQATGQYAFEGDWGRKCVCGHELGVHTAEAPHECMNSDRRHMYCDARDQVWFDQSIEPTPCDCIRFRPTRKRAQSGRE